MKHLGVEPDADWICTKDILENKLKLHLKGDKLKVETRFEDFDLDFSPELLELLTVDMTIAFSEPEFLRVASFLPIDVLNIKK